jgi:hypothetical protein
MTGKDREIAAKNAEISDKDREINRLTCHPEVLESMSLEQYNELESQLKRSLACVSTRKERLSYQSDHLKCVICLEKEKCILLLPCGHLCLCESCSGNSSLRDCPICRKRIGIKQRAYL